MQKQILDLLDGWLRHKSDMVNFEAARAICELKHVTATQLTKPIAGLFSLLLYTIFNVSCSPTTIPFIPQTGLEVRCDSYPRCTCFDSPGKRSCLQCGPRKSHRRSQQERCHICYHHSPQGKFYSSRQSIRYLYFSRPATKPPWIAL